MQDATTTTSLIRHPVWCTNVGADAPLAPEPVGSESSDDRLGPAEPHQQHEGRAFTLEAGETYAYRVTATPVQWFSDEGVAQEPEVRLAISDHELTDGSGESVYLNLTEVDQVVRLLQRAAQII